MPLLLADDLSGALDAGAPFCAHGWRVRLPLNSDHSGEPSAKDELQLISTESRNLGPEAAASAVRLAIESRDVRSLVFKKIDSTLRGPIAAELRAILELCKPPLVIVTPANPKAGRTVVNGCLFVNGKSVSVTEFARDPTSPVRTSNTIQLLHKGGLNHVSLLSLASLRQGPENIRECMRARMVVGEPVIVSDAETTDDMNALVSTALAFEPRTLFVGSGALAAALAEACESPPAAAGSIRQPDRGGDFVFLCGSKHPTSHHQMEMLARETGITLRKAALGKFQTRTLAAEIDADLQSRKIAAVLFSADDTDSPETSRALNEAIGRFATEINGMRATTGWFVTGGETARMLCKSLGGETLKLEKEISTGTVAAILAGPGKVPRWVVTKPGGFGGEKLLVSVLNWWRSDR